MVGAGPAESDSKPLYVVSSELRERLCNFLGDLHHRMNLTLSWVHRRLALQAGELEGCPMPRVRDSLAASHQRAVAGR